MVSRLNKLIQNVRFDDACKVAEEIGFVGKGGKGSHNSFSRTGERVGLNFQKREGGKIPPYQARQLIEMIDKYHEDQEPQKENNKREEEDET